MNNLSQLILDCCSPAEHVNMSLSQDDLCARLKTVITSVPKSLTGLKEKEAQKVYQVLKVKHFVVDYNHILCPRALSESKWTIEDILKSTESQKSGLNPTWSEFSSLIQPWLDLFADFQTLPSFKSDSFERKSNFSGFLSILDNKIDVVKTVGHVTGSRLHLLQCYFQSFSEKERLYVYPFRRFFDLMVSLMTGNQYNGLFFIEGNPWAPENFQFTVKSLGRTYLPLPDYCLRNGYSPENIIAVVSVFEPFLPPIETSDSCCHEGPRSEAASASECGETESDASVQRSPSEWDEIMDKRDQQECAEDAAETASLPSFLRPLDLKEKKEVRSFLPQLLGQLLGYSSIEKLPPIFNFQDCQTHRLGIAVVGFRVRFVTMVIVDKSRNITAPRASHISKENAGVCTYLYLTEPLDLFKKEDLIKFYKILFVLRYNSDVDELKL